MHGPIRRLATAATAALLVTGCATSGAKAESTRSQHNVVTANELARAGDAASLYDALEKLRPAMLRSHGGMGVMTGERTLQVYVGNQRLEGVDAMRSILARTVAEVRFLEPQQANARYGENNAGGALVITMIKP